MVCPAPTPSDGMALSLSAYFDCLAETLGREGFLAVSDYVLSSGLMTSLLVISVALVGYRLLFFGSIDFRFGVNWLVKLGIALTLLSSWPAFQALFYDVVIGGPTVVADLLLAALGYSPEGTLSATQRAYDALRLGTLMSPDEFRAFVQSEQFALQAGQLPTAMPEAANTMLVATVGAEGVLRVAVGFLLAIAPFPIAFILFSYSQGLFWGWLKAVIAGLFSIAAIMMLNTLHIATLAASIERIYDTTPSAVSAFDDIQSLPAITSIFSLLAIVLVVVIYKLSSSLIVVTKTAVIESLGSSSGAIGSGDSRETSLTSNPQTEERYVRIRATNDRNVALIDSLNHAVSRERRTHVTAIPASEPSSPQAPATQAYNRSNRRRVLGRRHASLSKRDLRQ